MSNFKPAPYGTPEWNPTNYDGINYKSHFTDNSWIQSRAVYQYENGLGIYYDCYVAATTPVPSKTSINIILKPANTPFTSGVFPLSERRVTKKQFFVPFL